MSRIVEYAEIVNNDKELRSKTDSGKTVLITMESIEKEHLSVSEAILLLVLYPMKRGIRSCDLKEVLLFLNGRDPDEAEESLESMKSEGYAQYRKKRWFIADDGIELLKKVATFGEANREK